MFIVKIFYIRYIQDVAIIVPILKFRYDKTITYGPNVILFCNTMCKQIILRWLFLYQGGVVLMK